MARYDVTDYGADPSGRADCTAAVRAAVAAAAAQEGPATVWFPHGTYRFAKSQAILCAVHTSNTDTVRFPVKAVAVLVAGCRDVELAGEDATWLLDGDFMTLAVLDSERITVRGLRWDVLVPTTSEMTVVDRGVDSSGHAWTDLWVSECMPYDVHADLLWWSGGVDVVTGEEHWRCAGVHDAFAIVGYDPATGVARRYPLAASPFVGVRGYERRDSGVLRITYEAGRPVEQERTGFVYQFTSSLERATAGALFAESGDIRVQDVHIHHLHGFGVLVQMCRDVAFRGVRWVPRPGSGHLTTSYADGLHVSGARGLVEVTGCDVALTHDDPINVHGTYLRVVRAVDEHSVTLEYAHPQQHGFAPYHVGDEVAFVSRVDLRRSGEPCHVVATDVSPSACADIGTSCTIRLDRPLPPGVEARLPDGERAVVVDNLTYHPDVRITGNVFASGPTRGVLVSTGGRVLVEGNHFDGMAMAAVFISGDADQWYESGAVRDVTIQGNRFDVASSGQTEWDEAPALLVRPILAGGRGPDAPVHDGIRFIDNQVQLRGQRLVAAAGVSDLVLTGNDVVVDGPPREPLVDLASCPGARVVVSPRPAGEPSAYELLLDDHPVEVTGSGVVVPVFADEVSLLVRAPAGTPIRVCAAFDRGAIGTGSGCIETSLRAWVGLSLYEVHVGETRVRLALLRLPAPGADRGGQ